MVHNLKFRICWLSIGRGSCDRQYPKQMKLGFHLGTIRRLLLALPFSGMQGEEHHEPATEARLAKGVRVKLATDIGGTFTDLVYLDEADRRARTGQGVLDAARLRARRSWTPSPNRVRPGEGRALRPWHDRRHQRADRAQRRDDRAGDDRGLPRRARDRPRQPARHLQPALPQATALRAARAALRSDRAHQLQGRGRHPARSRRVDAVASKIAGGGRRRRRGLLSPLLRQPGPRRGALRCVLRSCCRMCR